MTEEIWKDISGFEGLYQVSNLGNVRSLNYKNQTGFIKNMTPSITSAGYNHIKLRNGRLIMKSVDVHRLVAEEFIPNPKKLPQVNHKNEIKTDNRVDNLEWCTGEYNINYGSGKLRMTNTHIEKYGKPVRCIETKEKFISVTEASKRYGCNQGNISNACVGRNCTYTAGGYHWEFISKEELNND